MMELDGATLEGGGQLLRTALSLAAVLKKPCRVFNIRQNRPKPGLAPQHLSAVRALAQLCGGKLEGDELGSQSVSFWPGDLSRAPASCRVKIETAGSIALVLQTLILPALFAPSPIKIVFEGGATDTFFAPTMDYFRCVFLKILEKTGAKAEIDIQKRGYYPEGGAKVETEISPAIKHYYRGDRYDSNAPLKELKLTARGILKRILMLSGASESLKDKKVAERQVAGAKEILGKLKLPLEEKIEYGQSQCPGSQICLAAEFENTVIGADNLGTLQKSAEQVGREAALALLKEEKSGACLDRHLADQILVYLPFIKGGGQVRVSEITRHCQTAAWVIEKFLTGKMKIKDNLIQWLPEK